MENGQFPRKKITERTFSFGVEIVKIVALLPRTTAGYALGSQLVRAGTSIGANIEEAQDSFSRKEFVHSMNIALKEARETQFWLRIILEAGLIQARRLNPIIEENIELIKILTSIVKKTRSR